METYLFKVNNVCSGQTMELSKENALSGASCHPKTEILKKIAKAKKELGNRLLILGHHYQRDEIVRFCDRTGDSFELSKHAASCHDVEFIVFCGVHFMAESADILTGRHQKVMIPNMLAGCPLAEMASIEDVEQAWEEISAATTAKVIPITYINSSAAIKAFCGEREGIICTSSNAREIMDWGFSRGEKLLFLPDQHLGRNTGYTMGIPLEEMPMWNPEEETGGLTKEDIRNAKVILWNGYCATHQKFSPEHVDRMRENFPGINIIVHPECRFDVVQKSDYVGSTAYILKIVGKAEPGTRWAVGTEQHLVNRLASRYPDRQISVLSPHTAICPTMFKISPKNLLEVLEALIEGRILGQVSVSEEIANPAKKALDRMLSVPRNI